MTPTLQRAQSWDVTLHRRRGHLVITPQATLTGDWWRRPLLALADAVDAPIVLDLTRLDLDEVIVLAVAECLRGSAAAPWVAIRLVLTPREVDRIRRLLRPGGIGVYGSVDDATTS